MHLRDRTVAVIGGGVGGIAAALSLSRRGARVTVFEAAPAFGEVGAGLQIGPNGVAVLDALGLRTGAQDCATVPTAVGLRSGFTGRPYAHIPLGAAARARYGRPYWQFHRADLLGILVAALPINVALRLNTGVVRLDPEPSGVCLTPAGGPPERFEIAIAADGLRSSIRTDHFSGRNPRFTGHVAWRGLVPSDRLTSPIPPETRVFTGPGRHLVTYPLRGGKFVNIVAIEERTAWTAESWTQPDDPARVVDAFARWCPEVEELLATLTDTFLWGLFDHPPLAAWTKGRIALLGDACHPMLPFLAQGAAMALEDAWVLAAELDRDPDPESALRSYAARRQPRTARVQRAAARNGLIWHLRPPLSALARCGLAVASRVAPTRLLARFDWLYAADVTKV